MDPLRDGDVFRTRESSDSRLPATRMEPEADLRETHTSTHKRGGFISFLRSSKEDELKEQNENLKRHNSRLKEESQTLSMEKSCLSQDLRRSNDRVAALEREKKDLLLRECEANNENVRLEDKLKMLRSENQILKEQNTHTEKRMRDLEVEAEEAKIQQMYAESRRVVTPPKTEDTEDKTSQLKTEIREMTVRQKTLTDQNASLQGEVVKLQEKILTLRLKDEIREKTAKQKNLTDQQESHALSLKNKNLSEDLRKSQDRVAALEREKTELLLREHEANNVNVILEDKLKTFRMEIESLKEQNILTKKRVRDLEDEAEEAKIQQMYAESCKIDTPVETEDTADKTSHQEEIAKEKTLTD